jgi:tetratricopeptide (TPR) repeat protein
MYLSGDVGDLVRRGKRSYYAGDFRVAVESLGRALGGDPNNLDALLHYGAAMNRLGAPAQAKEALSRGIQINPAAAHLHIEIGNAHLQLGELDEAHAAIDRALALSPKEEPAVAAKADVYRMAGDHQAAYELVQPFVAGGSIRLAVAFGQACRQLDRFGEAIDALAPFVDGDDISAGVGVQALFVLGDLYDAQSEFDRAFACFTRANAARPSRFSIISHESSIDRLIAHWTKSAAGAIPQSSCDSELPVFVLGMPRSGTSLTEQILSCHPQVHSTGEFIGVTQFAAHVGGVKPPALPLIENPASISEHELNRFASAYVAHLAAASGGAARVTDKYPSNFFHVGPIAAALPHARIIHCRRNPLDTCLSCFVNNFAGGGLDFKQDLVTLGRYYRCYDKLMRHWVSVAEPRMIENSYESLVADQEGQSRRLVEFVGLEWNDTCLRFYESDRVTLTRSSAQVRKPMHARSVGRWRNYETHLGPLMDALGDLA